MRRILNDDSFTSAPRLKRGPLGSTSLYSQSVIIREAAHGDASSLANLLGQLGYPADARDLPRRLTRLTARGSAVAFVAELEGSVVGVATAHAFASIHAGHDVAWLTTLVVAQEARHRGVGRALVAAAEGWARTHDCRRLSVTTALHREDAHAFYDRLGYQHSGRRYTKTL